MNVDLIIEDINRNFEYIMFEAAKVRSPVLKNIDKNFDSIRKNTKDKQQIVDLVRNIKSFTGVKSVYFVVKENVHDACIFIKYNQTLPKVFKKDGENKLKTEKFKAEESPRYIKGIYVIFGTKTLDMFTPRELTAILLHEIGHIYQHTANFSMLLPTLVNQVAKGGLLIGALTLLRVIVFPAVSLILLPVVLSLFALSRSLTFADHMGELNADEYAVKYGYGDDLAKVFFKFNKLTGGKARPHTWIQKTWDSIKSFFSLSSYPKDSKRMCDIIDKMRLDYKKTYPKFSKEITTIYADIRC